MSKAIRRVALSKMENKTVNMDKQIPSTSGKGAGENVGQLSSEKQGRFQRGAGPPLEGQK